MGEQFMHFVELKTQLPFKGEGSITLSMFAYLFSAEEKLPAGQYEATSCTGGADACARAFVGCRDNKTFAFRTDLKIVDHTKGGKILHEVLKLDHANSKEVK